MTSTQRRITVAVCVLLGLSLLMGAGLTFLSVPLAEDLGLGDTDLEDLLAIPSAAAMVVVFSAGQLADRLGSRRILGIASVAFSLGAGLVAIAGSALFVEVGLAVCAVAAVTVLIVGMSVLQQATGGGPVQVSAFTWFGAVFPMAFLVFPVATAWILGFASWRVVPVTWVGAGIVMLAVTFLLPAAGEPVRSTGEWWTPLLAGVALAAGARAIAETSHLAADLNLVVATALVALVSAATCFIAWCRAEAPSFTVDPIRGRQLPLLLVAVALVTFGGLLTYVSIAVEFLYDLTTYEASLALIAAQIGSILGAKVLARRAIEHWGGVRAARILIFALAVAMLPLAMLGIDTALWWLVGVTTIFSFLWMAVLTVLNVEIMGRAPTDKTGAVASFRTAASSIGATIGAGTLGAIVIVNLPLDVVPVTVAESAALVDSLRMAGLLSSLIAIVGWIVVAVVQRRSAADPAEQGQASTPRDSPLQGE